MQLGISTLIALVLSSGNVQATDVKEVQVLSSYIVEVNPKVSEDKAEKIASSIVIEAKKAEVPVDLVTAIVEAESTFKTNAKSKEGAVGLMQVHKKSHPTLNTSGIRGNISSGIGILKQNLKDSSTLKKALTNYSGGHKKYHKRVMHLVEKYKKYKKKV